MPEYFDDGKHESAFMKILRWAGRCLSPSAVPQARVPVCIRVCSLIHCRLRQHYPAVSWVSIHDLHAIDDNEYLYFLLILDLFSPALSPDLRTVFTLRSSPGGLLIASYGSFVTVKSQTSDRGFGWSTICLLVLSERMLIQLITGQPTQRGCTLSPSSQQVQDQLLVQEMLTENSCMMLQRKAFLWSLADGFTT